MELLEGGYPFGIIKVESMAVQSSKRKLTDVLLRRGVIDSETLEQVDEAVAASGGNVEQYLLDKKFVSGPDMVLAMSEYLAMPPIRLSHFAPDPTMLKLAPEETWKKLKMLPVSHCEGLLTVALGDPFDIMGQDELRAATGCDLMTLVALESEVREVMGQVFAKESEGLDMAELMKDESGDVEVDRDQQNDDVNLEEMLQSAEGAPVIRMVNMMLLEAIRKEASDIHLEPMEHQLRLRYRIDGSLVEAPSPPKSMQAAVTSRIKIMSELNIAERRIPQDGRFRIKALGKEIDLRVSILPTVHGEKIVMRTLDKSSLMPNLAALKLDPVSERAMQYAIGQPHGILLVTGPTGSGKTTTLYSCLQELNQTDVNIITCEDPVEYQLAGINQVQMHEQVGLTFASALRSILRQDPDIILVGEIRDGETAEIAVKAALTGHLVLSTLHTNDAAGAVTRMVEMGIEPFLLASSVVLAQAQRLYRKLCPFCKKTATIDPEILEVNRIPSDFFEGHTVYMANGCPKCNNLGYKGRGAIMEVLLVDDKVREAVLRGANSGEIRDLGAERGMITLKQGGLNLVREGITSIEAALAVTGGD